MIPLRRELRQLAMLLDRADAWRFAGLLGLMVAASFLEAVGLGAVPAYVTLILRPSALAELAWIGSWFEDLPDTVTPALLFWASAILFALVVLKNLFLSLVASVQARVVAAQRTKLGDRMFRLYQSASFEWLLQRNTAEFLRNIQTDTAQVLNGFVMPLLNLVLALIMSGAVLAVLVLSTPLITAGALLVIAAGILGVTRLLQKRMRRSGEEQRRFQKEQTQAIQQGFGSVIDAKILGREEALARDHESKLERLAQAQGRQQAMMKWTPYAIESVAVLGLVGILFLLAFTERTLESFLPAVALLGVVMVRLKQVASQISTSINQINLGRAFVPAIVADLEELSAVHSTGRAAGAPSSAGRAFRQLRAEGVTYRYPGAEAPAVEGVDLEIIRGESVAITGPTGCGKSTLLNVILGLLVPQAGRVLVNGTNIHDDWPAWRARLGYVPQSVYLLDDTLRANIAFGVPDGEIDEDRLSTAIRMASLGPVVDGLPQGLFTSVGENGARLSGGQKQRVGIARVMYHDPEVLVLDEATAALDVHTEHRVLDAIRQMDPERTLLVVAHRPETVSVCDRVYAMDHGRIVDDGDDRLPRRTSSGYRGGQP